MAITLCFKQSKNVVCINKCLEDNPSRIDLITCKCFHENHLKEPRVQVVWAPSNSRLERFIPATSFGELGGEITAPSYNWLWLVDCGSYRQLLPHTVQDHYAVKGGYIISEYSDKLTFLSIYAFTAADVKHTEGGNLSRQRKPRPVATANFLQSTYQPLLLIPVPPLWAPPLMVKVVQFPFTMHISVHQFLFHKAQDIREPH